LTLKDGRTIEKRVDIFKGDFRNPLTQKEVEEKFNRCANRVLSSTATKEFANKIMNIEGLENIGNMMNIFI
jgi:2-methylcitrate dehydratase